MKGKLYEFNKFILESEEFQDTCYYLLCMKQPITKAYQTLENSIPFFLRKIYAIAISNYLNFNIDVNDMLELLRFDSQYWHVLMRSLKLKENINSIDKGILYMSLPESISLGEFYTWDDEHIIGLYTSYLVSTNIKPIRNLHQLVSREVFKEEVNKYGLSLVENVEYKLQGFVHKEQYYLYNYFVQSERLEFMDYCPATFKLFHEEFKMHKVYLRLDSNLSVPKSEMFVTASYDFAHYRGISLKLDNIGELMKKEIIVHYNLENMDKLLVIIKPDFDEKLSKLFYHIEIEQLHNPDNVISDNMFVRFIHSKYYPDLECFNHLDFSVNQYDYYVYYNKYQDYTTETDTFIDTYGDVHYKVWCVEGESISFEQWYKLVYVTLEGQFRDLLDEVLHMS